MAGYLAWLFAFLWLLPRLAHRAYGQGKWGKSLFWYRFLLLARLGKDVRGRLKLSVAACLLKQKGTQGIGKTQMKSLKHTDLDEEAKAVYFNNKAYMLWQRGRDLDAALTHVETALMSRPGVPDFWHTKGLIFEALEKNNAALSAYKRVLETPKKWLSDELEAECRYKVGMIWLEKGHKEFGQKFFRQVAMVSPDSTWSQKATSRLAPVLTEFSA